MEGKYYPDNLNIGSECGFWELDGCAHCCFPKYELHGRTTCLGVIDDVCLYIKDGRTPTALITTLLLEGINLGTPDATNLPPGQLE